MASSGSWCLSACLVLASRKWGEALRQSCSELMVPRASHCEHCFIREYYWRRGPLGGFQLIDGCAASPLSCGFLLEQIPLLFRSRREQSPQFGELRGQSLLRCLGLPFVGAVAFPRDDGGGGVRFCTSAVGVQARPPSRIQRASAFTIDSSFLGSESAMTDERLSGKPSWGHLASVQGHSGALGRLGALSRSTQVRSSSWNLWPFRPWCARALPRVPVEAISVRSTGAHSRAGSVCSPSAPALQVLSARRGCPG